MLAAVADLPKEIKDMIDYHEWSLRNREGIDLFKRFNARSLPSIAINGEIRFASIIPTQEDLIKAITQKLNVIE
jgi:uroporphyrinogen decarboxylase